MTRETVYVFAVSILLYQVESSRYWTWHTLPPPPPITRAPKIIYERKESNLDYMVCKSISGVFGSRIGEGGSSTILRGPEGYPGPLGATGARGPRGGMNYEEAEKIIEDSLTDIKAKVYSLELEVDSFPVIYGTAPPPEKPSKSPDQIANETRCKETFDSPTAIGNMCYNIIGEDGSLWSQTVAQSKCERLNGNLADLESREVYNAIYDLADQRYNVTITAWTGMRFEGGKLRTRNNDTEISYAKWTSGYPRKISRYSTYYASFTGVYISIDTSAHSRRLYNVRPTYRYTYAICSYDLEKGNSTVVTTTAATNSSTVSTSS